MARNFEIDKDAAVKANDGGKRIRTTGKYVGVIRAAWYDKNTKGTESVSLTFVADNGQEAGPLTLYTHNANGEQLVSYNTLNAILTCTKVRQLQAQPGEVELYDFDQRANVKVKKDTYPALAGKRIGLVLQQEEYTKQDGSPGERIVIAAPFEAATGLMAGEILAKEITATALPRFMEWIEKNPVKKQRAARGNGNAANGGGNSTPARAADIPDDDDIPF